MTSNSTSEAAIGDSHRFARLLVILLAFCAVRLRSFRSAVAVSSIDL